MSKLILNEKSIHMHDGMGNTQNNGKSQILRGRVMMGYDRYVDRRGISQLGEIVFEEDNMVVIGGVQYTMEQIFGIKGSIDTKYLNDTMKIGAQGYIPPSIDPYPYGHSVCLFGVGVGGAGDNNSSVLDVKYQERTIVDMIPFRFTNEPITGTDANKYFGKKEIDGTTAFYLKMFDAEPTIKHLWKDGELDEDGTEVDNSVFDVSRVEKIESFTEILATLNRKDIKEWYAANGNIENAKVNSVALFTGIRSGDDYAMIKMFSKLNIPNEPLSLSKDLEIIYRVYGS